MRSGRMTIGLYNSYDPRRFREAHRRALARAGPLALAFDANLALFGFPFPEDLRKPQEVAHWVADTTSIGNDGQYLRDLSMAGRFHLFPYPGRGFSPQLGRMVLTTCRPISDLGVGGVVDILRRGESLCLLFGLGPHGTPDKAARPIDDHLDVTGSGHSLETCTAMGAVVASVANVLGSQ